MEDPEPVLSYRPPKPKPQRRKVSPCNCLAYTCLVFGIAIVCLITYMIGKAVLQIMDDARHPHKAHHYSGSLIGTEADRGSVVWPILGDDARFDVAATLWYSLPRKETEENDVAEDEATEEEKVLQRYWQLPLNEIRPIPKQVPLLSEVVFRNASFKDKNLYRQIKYKLPLERFRLSNLSAVDVRATFVLLPLNSTRFDRVTNFSDWRPEEIEIPPTLPLFEDGVGQYPEQSIQKQLLQRWGVSIPLLRFYDIPLQCPQRSIDIGPQSTTLEDGTESSVSDSNTEIFKAPNSELQRKHPHVMTRSHVVVITETRPYNRTAFLLNHARLRETSCKGPAMNLARHFRFCGKTYSDMGEFGLNVDFEGEEGEQETGYLPFLGALPDAAGPKDTVRMPVIPHDCRGTSEDSSTSGSRENVTHLDLTWNLQFSAVTAGRVIVMTNIIGSTTPSFEPNATEQEMIVAQDSWEQTAGLTGHRTEGAHPWTRFLTTFAIGPLLLLVHLLDMMYWYTRTSVVGLDIWATACLALVALLEIVCPPIFDKDDPFATGSGPMRVLYLIMGIWFSLPAVLMLRAILPFTVTWDSWTRLDIQRSRRTHRERASKRIADRLAPSVRLMTILVLTGIRYLMSHFRLNRYVVSPAAPNPSRNGGYLESILFNLTFGLQLSGNLLQILMNSKSSTFAGRYRFAEVLSASLSLLWVLRLSTHFVGKRNPTYSLTVVECFELAIEMVKAYQAFVLPRVEQEVVDEEEE